MSPSMDLDVAQEQSKRNLASRESWDEMRHHRQRVMRELLLAAPARGTVALLGAGNCNDVDLRRLLDAFAEVHLVDTDGASLQFAVERQRVADHPGLHLRQLDFSGLPSNDEGRSAQHDGPGVVSDWVEALRKAKAPMGVGPFDCVVSACVLSQLIEIAPRWLGPSHPATRDVALALRQRHLALLGAWTRPGGRALLLSDFVSSDTAPQLASVSKLHLARLAEELERQGNVFYGLGPSNIERAIRTGFPHLETLTRRPVWRWQLFDRTFLVGAWSLKRLDG